MKSWISKSILFVLTLLSLSCKEDDPAVKLYQGEVHYYDTDEPMAGVDLRVKFYHSVPGILDESQYITEFITTTDSNGKFAFDPHLPPGPYSYTSMIQVASKGLIQMTEQHYPDCEELRGIQFLFIVGRTEPPNHVNTFYIDSAAYLQVEFIKTSSSNTTVEYWGYCGAGPFTGREYSSTQESPNLTVTETIPTLGAGKAFERSVQYQVIGTPNNAGFQSVRASLTAGETTVVKFEY